MMSIFNKRDISFQIQWNYIFRLKLVHNQDQPGHESTGFTSHGVLESRQMSTYVKRLYIGTTPSAPLELSLIIIRIMISFLLTSFDLINSIIRFGNQSSEDSNFANKNTSANNSIFRNRKSAADDFVPKVLIILE